VGRAAGHTSQDIGATAVGHIAGYQDQGYHATAVGRRSAQYGQQQYAVAIGADAGRYCQQQYAVAIGYQAGYGNNCCGFQGQYSVAIGYNAGYCYQNQYSIAINATDGALNPDNSGLYINPVREDTESTEYSVYYNYITKELTYTVPVGPTLPQNLQDGNGDYTLLMSDAGKHIYKTGTGNILIPTNAEVAFQLGTTITLVTGDTNSTRIQAVDGMTTTLILSKFGTDASINVPVDTYVTILKIETDKWMVQT
jgi:hypothetical protein